MSSLKELLRRSFYLYPVSTAEDYYKLLFQSCFGPQHLQQDPSVLKEYFLKEWNATPSDSLHGTLMDDITLQYPVARIHFSTAKNKQLNPELLFSTFLQTMSEFQPISVEAFHALLDESKEHLMKAPFLLFGDRIDSVWQNGYSATPTVLHHSPQFNQAYQAHYRLINPSLLDRFNPVR